MAKNTFAVNDFTRLMRRACGLVSWNSFNSKQIFDSRYGQGGLVEPARLLQVAQAGAYEYGDYDGQFAELRLLAMAVDSIGFFYARGVLYGEFAQTLRYMTAFQMSALCGAMAAANCSTHDKAHTFLKEHAAEIIATWGK